MTVEAIARAIADIRDGRSNNLIPDRAEADGQTFSDVARKVVSGPIVDATPIYQSLVSKATPVAVYEDHPCIAPPWTNACICYVNEHGNVVVMALSAVEIDGCDSPLWESHLKNQVDWANVRWVSTTMVWVGGHSKTNGPIRTTGPVHVFQHAVYPDGAPADLHWVRVDERFAEGHWDMAHLVLLGALNFVSCRNVALGEPGRPRPLARRLARHGVTVNEIMVYPTGRNPRRGGTESVGGQPLTVVRGHFSHYGPDYGKGLLFGKLAGRFWHPQSARGDAEVGTVEHNYTLVPK